MRAAVADNACVQVYRNAMILFTVFDKLFEDSRIIFARTKADPVWRLVVIDKDALSVNVSTGARMCLLLPYLR